MQHRVQYGVGVIERRESPGVGGAGGDVLADHDDAQQDQLDERLGDPGDDRRATAVDSVRQRHERDETEAVGAPHGADAGRYPESQPGVEARAGGLGVLWGRAGLEVLVRVHHSPLFVQCEESNLDVFQRLTAWASLRHPF